MDVVGSTDRPHTKHFSPRYSEDENPDMDSSELLPLFTRLDFNMVPIELQPAVVLKSYLLNHGVPTTDGVAPEMIRKLATRVDELPKQVLDPSLAVELAKWVGFEPLDGLQLGDKYDDWVSAQLYSFSSCISSEVIHIIYMRIFCVFRTATIQQSFTLLKW